MAFLSEYGLFLAKSLTALIVFLAGALGCLAIFSKNKKPESGHLEIHQYNTKLKKAKETIEKAIYDKKTYKALIKAEKIAEKKQENRKKIYLLNFKGDIKASTLPAFREEITAILSVASPKDEVIVNLESAGGMVHAYGLAASQLQRIKEKKIPLTVCIDKVAASGGYLMACVADKIIAAPFAIIGSIGVIAQIPNINRLLKKNAIDFEMVTAGEFKRTLTIFGENTDKAREKLQSELEEIHHLFKSFILTHRPHMHIAEVATGEHWLGTQALELALVDKIQTSDDYYLEAAKHANLYTVTYQIKQNLAQKLTQASQSSLKTLVETLGSLSQKAFWC